MNDLLSELRKDSAPHVTTEDVFAFSRRVFKNFGAIFQEWESDLRKLELVASLFDHVAVECVNDVTGVAKSCEYTEGGVEESKV